MKRKGLSVFYVIMSMFLVLVAGYMLIKMLDLKMEKVCTYEDQGTCCPSIMDDCDTYTDLDCVIGTCETFGERSACNETCNREEFCTVIEGAPDAAGNTLHACVSENCNANVHDCTPVECTMTAFRYHPEKDWWYVLETNPENRCCTVTGGHAGSLERDCQW